MWPPLPSSLINPLFLQFHPSLCWYSTSVNCLSLSFLSHLSYHLFLLFSTCDAIKTAMQLFPSLRSAGTQLEHLKSHLHVLNVCTFQSLYRSKSLGGKCCQAISNWLRFLWHLLDRYFMHCTTSDSLFKPCIAEKTETILFISYLILEDLFLLIAMLSAYFYMHRDSKEYRLK